MSDDDTTSKQDGAPEKSESWLSQYGWDLYLLCLLLVILALVVRWFTTRASKSDVASVRSAIDWNMTSVSRRLDVLETIVRIREKEAAA